MGFVKEKIHDTYSFQRKLIYSFIYMESGAFREKTPQELQAQVKRVHKVLGVNVAPHSWEMLNKYEIQEKYAVRYEAYLAALRAERNGIKDEEVTQKSKEYVTALNNLAQFVEGHGEGELDARGERQSSVFKDLQSFLEEGKTSGYVKLPTGVGKTVIFAKLIESLGLKALVVVPTKTLVTQTGERFEQFTDIEFGKLYSQQKDYNSPVTITTYASLVANVKNGLLTPPHCATSCFR